VPLARSLPFLLIAGLLACSEDPSSSVCGESFCFPKGTKLLSRQTPVEDFNLYRVEAKGQRFVVYEGNAPQRRKGSIVIPWAEGWPTYLEVNGPCASPSNCAAKSFAAEITRL
jgi:hypothetical protein